MCRCFCNSWDVNVISTFSVCPVHFEKLTIKLTLKLENFSACQLSTKCSTYRTTFRTYEAVKIIFGPLAFEFFVVTVLFLSFTQKRLKNCPFFFKWAQNEPHKYVEHISSNYQAMSHLFSTPTLNFVFFCKRDWWEIKVLNGSSMVIVDIKKKLQYQYLADASVQQSSSWFNRQWLTILVLNGWNMLVRNYKNFSSIHIQLSYSSCLLAGPLL